ncbi:helix-turn-helix transcriptional regulator [Cohnella sp. REN36]|uniref:helix-turn-helix transcriptional regulator n=1 Tax=Cohnella sp. REN36 TaxID=2887347 RepID=UPI001D156369|nr:helix-turn-helix transcriptional regulator [Cohnella sp. REN36]
MISLDKLSGAYPAQSKEVSQTMLSPIFVSFAKRYKLTTRETQVMKILVLEGKRNDDIASMLFISPKTLKNHLAFMMRKTGTSSARGLISLFFKHAMQILLPSV